MTTAAKQVLFWSPRILCILFSAFISMFALDVFNEGYGFGETILALIMHLIPTYCIVIMLVIAWRWEGIGAILFMVLPLFYLVMSRGESWILSAPLFVTGVLFLFNRIYRAKLKTNSTPPGKAHSAGEKSSAAD
jgi:hypothetical protein